MTTKIARFKPLYPVELIVDGKQHFYKLGDDETYHPGVTTILGAALPKPALLPWAVKMMGENIREYLTARDGKPFLKDEIDALIQAGKDIYKKKAEAAADIGTRAHKVIDSILLGVDCEVTDDIKPCIDAFQDWRGRQTLTFDLGDTKIGSKVFGYGGSLDCVAWGDSGPVLIDLKTSKAIYDEYAYQLAAYVQAFRETYGVEVKEAIILRLGKDKPEFEVKRVANLSACLDGFLAALKLYNLNKWKKFEEIK